MNTLDKKDTFLMASIGQIGIQVTQEEIDPISIPVSHKNMVRERTRKSMKDPARLLDWEQIDQRFIFG